MAQHIAHESSKYWTRLWIKVFIIQGNTIADCAPIEDTPTVGPFPVNHLPYPIYFVG